MPNKLCHKAAFSFQLINYHDINPFEREPILLSIFKLVKVKTKNGARVI